MNQHLRGWAHELRVRGCHTEGFANLPLDGRFASGGGQFISVAVERG